MRHRPRGPARTGRDFVETARPVGSIVVGHRHRTDLGDLDSLQRSIQEVGLLQPITITPDGVLLCGLRRLEAVKRLGWRNVRCWVRSGLSHDLGRLLAEREENTQRKPLAPLEAAALYQELKAVLAQDAARRKHATTFGARHEADAETPADGQGANRGTVGRGDSPPPHDLHGRTRAQAARLVTGNAGYKRLEQLTALQRWTTDPRQAPAIRQMAVAELTHIQAGAPVQPAFDRVRHAIATTRAAETTTARAAEDVVALQLERLAAQALERIKTEQRTGRMTKRAFRPKHRTPRWFILTWTELDGWTTTVNVDELATTLTDTECDLFRRVLAETERFADLPNPARLAGARPRSSCRGSAGTRMPLPRTCSSNARAQARLIDGVASTASAQDAHTKPSAVSGPMPGEALQ